MLLVKMSYWRPCWCPGSSEFIT